MLKNINANVIHEYFDRTIFLKKFFDKSNCLYLFTLYLNFIILVLFLIACFIKREFDSSFTFLIIIVLLNFSSLKKIKQINQDKQTVYLFYVWIFSKFTIFLTFILGGAAVLISGEEYGWFFIGLGSIWIPSFEYFYIFANRGKLIFVTRWILTIMLCVLAFYRGWIPL